MKEFEVLKTNLELKAQADRTAINYEKLGGKKEVTNNKVKIPDKARKNWMAVKEEL